MRLLVFLFGLPAYAARLGRGLRRSRTPDPLAAQADAISLLQRHGLLTAPEAATLICGERLADLYAELHGEDIARLDEIAALIRAGDLPEAIVQLGRLHRALSDLPHLFDRSRARARA